MRMLSVAALVAAALVALPAVSGAQSLAEIAAREKERRKNQKPAKVYTENDVRRGAGELGEAAAVPPPAETGAKAEGAAAAPAKPEKSDEEKKAEQQKAWRERLKKTTEDVTRLGAEVDRLQAAADGNSNFFSATRTSLVSQLDQAKVQLEQAKQTLSELEEEGRRNLYR
jgi:hypothetical protein